MGQLPEKLNTPARVPAPVAQGKTEHRAPENRTRQNTPHIENREHEKKNRASTHSVLVFL
jgi:hypothetical protein